MKKLIYIALVILVVYVVYNIFAPIIYKHIVFTHKNEYVDLTNRLLEEKIGCIDSDGIIDNNVSLFWEPNQEKPFSEMCSFLGQNKELYSLYEKLKIEEYLTFEKYAQLKVKGYEVIYIYSNYIEKKNNIIDELNNDYWWLSEVDNNLLFGVHK